MSLLCGVIKFLAAKRMKRRVRGWEGGKREDEEEDDDDSKGYKIPFLVKARTRCGDGRAGGRLQIVAWRDRGHMMHSDAARHGKCEANSIFF